MASNPAVSGAVPDTISEKKQDDAQHNLEAGSTRIEPCPVGYPGDDEKDGSVEINYHTLTWWYVF
jgi:hypothetical protein